MSHLSRRSLLAAAALAPAHRYQGPLAAAWKNMEKAGVKRIQSTDLAA